MPFSLDINPKYISLASVVISLLVLFTQAPIFLAVIVLVVLYLDSLDGLVARRYDRTSREGHLTDISCDRFSELIIFFFNPFLLILVYINIILSIFNLKRGTWILPLRHVYLIYLIYLILI